MIIAIIAILISLLLPAIQEVRESANRTHCANNLKQIGIAIHHYEETNGNFPPNGTFGVSATFSVLAHILPYVEQSALFQQFDFTQSVTNQPNVTAQRIALYVCPSEVNDRAPSTPQYPTNYAGSYGDWFIGNIATGSIANGAFPINPLGKSGRRMADITDGTNSTVGLAEVKAFGSYRSGSISPPSTPPNTPADVLALGGSLKASASHISWAEGFAQNTGVTFVFPPNTATNYVSAGRTYDVDYGYGSLTADEYAALTSRSYHPGGVNALFMDGSVHFITNRIPQLTWRALGTRNGGEPVGEIDY